MIQESINKLSADPRCLWLPPGKMRYYTAIKFLGTLMIGSIFVGWLIWQWDNVLLRVLCLGMLSISAWVVWSTTRADKARYRHRQIAIDKGILWIDEPGKQTQVALNQIALAQWRDGPAKQAGLALLGQDQKLLARLSLDFLGDQSEARSFLHWARRLANIDFPVRWPSVAG